MTSSNPYLRCEVEIEVLCRHVSTVVVISYQPIRAMVIDTFSKQPKEVALAYRPMYASINTTLVAKLVLLVP